MSNVKDDVIQIDNAVVEAIAAKAVETLKDSMPKAATAEEIAEAMAAKSEKTVKKEIHENTEKEDQRNLKKVSLEWKKKFVLQKV